MGRSAAETSRVSEGCQPARAKKFAALARVGATAAREPARKLRAPPERRGAEWSWA